MKLEDLINKETYEGKYIELINNKEKLIADRNNLSMVSKNENNMKQQLKDLKRTLEENKVLDKFDRKVFESVIEKVIIGERDKDGIIDPTKITFIYKTGLKNSLSSDEFKIPRKNARGRHRRKEVYLHNNNEVENSYSHSTTHTC